MTRESCTRGVRDKKTEDDSRVRSAGRSGFRRFKLQTSERASAHRKLSRWQTKADMCLKAAPAPVRSKCGNSALAATDASRGEPWQASFGWSRSSSCIVPPSLSRSLSIRRDCARGRRRFSPLFSSSSSSMFAMMRDAVKDHWHRENKGYNGRRIQWSIVAVCTICRIKLIIGEERGRNDRNHYLTWFFCSLAGGRVSSTVCFINLNFNRLNIYYL